MRRSAGLCTAPAGFVAIGWGEAMTGLLSGIWTVIRAAAAGRKGCADATSDWGLTTSAGVSDSTIKIAGSPDRRIAGSLHLRLHATAKGAQLPDLSLPLPPTGLLRPAVPLLPQTVSTLPPPAPLRAFVTLAVACGSACSRPC